MIRSLVLTAVVCLATAGFAQIPLGPEFQVNSYTTGSQFDPHLAMAGDGSVVVTWQAFGSPGDDDDSLSTQARRLGGSVNLGSLLADSGDGYALTELPRSPLSA